MFLATTGSRRGEAPGLCWADADLDHGRVSIRQAITAIDHRIKVGSRTKTANARLVELDGRTITALRTWKARQAEERLLMGAGYQDCGLVFCHPDGRPYHPERFSREFDRMVERLGMRRVRVHDLRYTWATLALGAGVPLKVVSERLGHATTAVTADTYSHVTPGMQTDAAQKVAALIFREV
jgi:integrase